MLLLLLFLTFSVLLVLVANPKKLLYTVANPARDLLNRENITRKKKSGSIPPPPTPQTARSEKNKNKIKITRRICRRYAGLGRSCVRIRISSARRLGTRPTGVASQNSTLLLFAMTSFLVSLLLSSPGDVFPRLPLLSSTRPHGPPPTLRDRD